MTSRINSHVIEEIVITERKCSTQFDGIKANFLRLGSTNVGILGRDM